MVDIVAALAKNIFAGFVKVTGCGRDTLKKIKSSVYGSYLEEKSYARYLLGVIPLAIPMLNIAYTDYNTNECTFRFECRRAEQGIRIEEEYHQYSKRAVSTLENMSTQE